MCIMGHPEQILSQLIQKAELLLRRSPKNGCVALMYPALKKLLNAIDINWTQNLPNFQYCQLPAPHEPIQGKDASKQCTRQKERYHHIIAKHGSVFSSTRQFVFSYSQVRLAF